MQWGHSSTLVRIRQPGHKRIPGSELADTEAKVAAAAATVYRPSQTHFQCIREVPHSVKEWTVEVYGWFSLSNDYKSTTTLADEVLLECPHTDQLFYYYQWRHGGRASLLTDQVWHTYSPMKRFWLDGLTKDKLLSWTSPKTTTSKRIKKVTSPPLP